MLEDDFDEDELDTVFGSWQRSGGMELPADAQLAQRR